MHAAPVPGVARLTATDLAFLDDEEAGQTVFGLKVLGRLDELARVPHDAVIVAIGDNRARAEVLGRLRSENVVSAIHESTVVARSVEIGAGTMIGPGVVVNPLVRLGEGVILNTGCTVDHHGHIGSYVHVAPGAHLGGNVELGEGAFVGIGASIAPGVRVGAWAIVGAGAAVVSDVAAGTTVVGVPARPLAKGTGR